MFRNIRHKNAFGTPSYVELILNSYFQKSNLEHVLKTAIIFPFYLRNRSDRLWHLSRDENFRSRDHVTVWRTKTAECIQIIEQDSTAV